MSDKVVQWLRECPLVITGMGAVSAAARAESTLVPSEQLPCLSGAERVSRAASSLIRPDVNNAGMSDKNTGTKSARPFATASRSGPPVNSDITAI